MKTDFPSPVPEKDLETLKEFFAAEPEVRFAYLFGSRARGTAGPLSDLDIAVYLDAKVDFFTIRLRLMESLAKKLGSERFDLVVLNLAPVVLRFEVIQSGVALKDDPEQRVDFETQVLRRYLDTIYLRRVHREYLKESLLGVTHAGAGLQGSAGAGREFRRACPSLCGVALG